MAGGALMIDVIICDVMGRGERERGGQASIKFQISRDCEHDDNGLVTGIMAYSVAF